MEFDDFPIILGMSSSQLTNIFQRGRAQPPSSVARSCYCSSGFPEGFPAKKPGNFLSCLGVKIAVGSYIIACFFALLIVCLLHVTLSYYLGCTRDQFNQFVVAS